MINLHLGICTTFMPGTWRYQKRSLDSLESTDASELPCGCWKLKPGPLETQQALLTTEQSLQPQQLAIFASVVCALGMMFKTITVKLRI